MENPPYVSAGDGLGVIKAVVLTTAMFSAMGGPVLAPALPAIMSSYEELPRIEFWVKILVSVTGLFSAIGAPLFGWLSDRWCRKRALILALCLWGAAGLSGILPQPFWTLLAGRGLLGLSLGGLLAANTTLIAESFTAESRKRMMGFQSASSSFGVVVALLAAGLLADLHWRWSFAIFGSAFVLLPFALRIREPDNAGRASCGIAPTQSIRSTLFLLCLFAFLIVLGFNVVPTQLPFFAKSQGIRTSSELGFVLAVMPLASAAGGRFYGRISHVFSTLNVFFVSGFILLCGFLILSFASGHLLMVVSLAVIGAGFGLAMPHVNAVLSRLAVPKVRGRCMGWVTASKFMGQFFSPILLQPVLVHGGYGFMLRVSGGMMAGACALTWAIGRILFKRGEERTDM